MKIWGLSAFGVGGGSAAKSSDPIAVGAAPSKPIDPTLQDRPIGFLEAIALSTGVKNNLKSRIPPQYFGWLLQIRHLQPSMRAMSEPELLAGWARMRARVKDGAPIPSLVPEAFAIMREISRRTLGEEPFEVQLLTAMGMLDHKAVELKTGEGKSLAIVLAASLTGLEGKGVHVIAESTESAERDAQRYRKLYRALDLQVGVIKDVENYEPSAIQKEKREAYAADVTYGFCDNFIFDRLQDSTWTEARMRVQRAPAYALVDEADNVLLDIARQPVILTTIGPAPDPAWAADLILADRVASELKPGTHFEVRHENERRHVLLTEEGFDALEVALRKAGRDLPREGLAHPTQYGLYHALSQTMIARHALFAGKHFVGDGVLVNQHNGRAQPLSRFFHGGSDAVALRLGKPLEAQTVVVGQSSYQDFFSSYPHLSGVSGTLEDAHDELRKVYGLEAIEIPTRLPSRLTIEPDEIYINDYLDRAASVAKVLEAHHQGDRPVLFPAVTVEQSKMLAKRLRDPILALGDVAVSSLGLLVAATERLEGGASIRERWLSRDLDTGRDVARGEIVQLLRSDPAGREKFVAFLEEHGFPARPLLGPPATPSLVNAENGEHLAVYVARAGKAKALTVTTLMGRATDVRPEQESGLLVICYGHRSSRRDDLQVAGRAGRQGQPGTVQFFSSLNDETLSGLPAKMLRSLRDQLTDYDRLRPTERLRGKVMSAIRRAQKRMGADAETGRVQRAKLDRVVAFKRHGLEEERREILERSDLPEVIEHWVYFEAGRSLLRRQLEQEAERWTTGQLEAVTKVKLNEAWILPGQTAARILAEAGVPPLADQTLDIPLETLFQHAGIDVDERKNMAKTEVGRSLCRAVARWKIRRDASGMSHTEISRRLAAQSTETISTAALKELLAELDLPTDRIEAGVRVGELSDLFDRILEPYRSLSRDGLIEDRPALTLNQRVRDLLLDNMNAIFCDFLEREAAFQENLASLVAFADRDPTVEYWQRASKEFDHMQALVQQTTARAFVSEMKRLSQLAQPSGVPEALDPVQRSQLTTFFKAFDGFTYDIDPHLFKSVKAADQARALVDELPATPARLFGSILHPLLDHVRDFAVGILPREQLHLELLEARVAMIEAVKDWPEKSRTEVMSLLAKHLPPLAPSPRLANPSPESLAARLQIEEMAPRSIRKREAGLRPDGTKLMMEEFLLGRVASGDHPLIQSGIERLQREGGAIYAIAAQDRERRDWLAQRSPPFFVTDDGSPYIAIDLTRDGAIEALAHELKHFERWRARRDELIAGGAKPAEAARRALGIENEPENLIAGETACVGEELRVQREGDGGWNVSGRPTKPEQAGWISRMSYPRIQGLRQYLWQEKRGDAAHGDEERCRELLRELKGVAEQARGRRAAAIERGVATATDRGERARLAIHEAVFRSRSVFDDVFHEFDLALFEGDETDERLKALWREIA